jgi:O-glycosyl hydrolase
MLKTVLKMKKIFLLKILFFICVYSYSQTDIITINPEDVNQNVVFGGDNKLTVKSWAEGSTYNVSRLLYQDMNLKILRIPIFALQDISDPIYDNVISVVNSVKFYNPDVKIFASIANGDGYGADIHGAPKFPSGWTGCCPSNVYNLNITRYSAYLDSFMQRMTDAGITIDYLGPYNEDPGGNSDYSKITAQMTKLGDTKMIGLERWALEDAVDNVDDVENQVSIIGSHFYDDEKIPEADWDSTWASLVQKSEHPVWYTEATRYSIGDNIDLLIAGMDNIFAPIKGGAEAIIYYQVCKRFVYANGSTLPVKYSGFKNITNNSEGKVITSTSNNSNIKVVTFGNDNTLDVHIINKNTTDNVVNLQLLNNYLGNGVVNRKLWTASDTGIESTYTLTNNPNWNISVPANSYSHIKVTLNKPILNTTNMNYVSKEVKVFPNPSNGNFQLNLPASLNGEEVLLKIHSINGKEIFSKKSIYKPGFSLRKQLTSGVYIITMTTTDNIIYKGKIVVK